MEAVILVGIPASGKTSFYAERFLHTHVRISRDLLRTPARVARFVALCLETGQPFVVDNTNVTREERARFLAPAREAGFRVVGYFFPSDPKAAFERNRRRAGRAAVPAAGLFGTQKRLEAPVLDEGFDALFTVALAPGGGFAVS